MPRKRLARVVTGPYCDRCDQPIVGPVIEVGLRNRCVACLLRPNVLVNYAMRQQREKEGGAPCQRP
jgi:hypothetical protein